MREIKVRAWYKNQYWYFHMNQPFSEFECDVHNSICLEGIEFEQYTGLKDKNGKEIYEGDMLKESSSDMVMTVMFKNGKYGYLYHGVHLTLDGVREYKETIEIIGNIHNKEE